MPTIAATVLGTELLERVRDRAARYEPLGYNAIRDAETAIESYCSAAEAVLRLERWDLTFRDYAAAALTFDKIAALAHGCPADCPDLILGYNFELTTPVATLGASTPTQRKSGVFDRQQSTPSATFQELVRSPSRTGLRQAKSFVDVAGVTLAGSLGDPTGAPAAATAAAAAAPAATGLGAAAVPNPLEAHCAQARLAINAAVVELQALTRIADLTFRELSQIHFEIAMAGTKWRWVAQRSHRSRFGLRMLIVPWRDLFTKIPRLIFLSRERLRVLREEDKMIHDALLQCRLCDLAVTQTIGTMHSVVSTLRAAMDDMLDDLESRPAAVTELDHLVTADLLTKTAQELRNLAASASSKMISACGVSSHHVGATMPSSLAATSTAAPVRRGALLERPAHVALEVKEFLQHLRQRLLDHQPPDAWPRIRNLCLGGTIAALVLSRDRISELPRYAELAAESMRTYMIEPTIRLVQKFFAPREQRNFSTTAKEQRDLKQMVVAYHQDMATDKLTPAQVAQIEAAVDRNDLGRVSTDFVEFTRKPWMPIIRGLLQRVVLIQIQQQKVDVGALIDSTNDILHQNDMAVSMFACTPFGVMLAALLLWWRQRQLKQRQALYSDMRVCWWKLHRIMCGQNATSHRAARSRAAQQEEDDEREAAAAAASAGEGQEDAAEEEGRGEKGDYHRRHVTHALTSSSMNRGSARPPPLKTSTPPHPSTSLRRPDSAPPQSPTDSLVGTVDDDDAASGGRRGGRRGEDEEEREEVESSSWGGALQPREQGQVLIQVHALRVMSEMVWPDHNAEPKMRCLDDLDEIEAKDASREARLRVLDRMALSYNFLRLSEF